jgi:hypothetical protein
MNGRLHLNGKKEWVIKYTQHHPSRMVMEYNMSIPLHPNKQELMLNRNPTLWDGKEIEFEIITEYIDQHTNQVQKYAKLIKQYPELEGTINLCNDKIWDDIYDEYTKEQYPAFGGPFTNSISFIDWLKQYYKTPEKINNER